MNDKQADTSPLPSLDDLISSTKPRETNIELCLRGDLFGERERLVSDIARLTSGPSLTPPPELVEAQERLDDLRTKMIKFTYRFWFRAIEPLEYDALKDAHPLKETKNGKEYTREFLIAVMAGSIWNWTALDHDRPDDDRYMSIKEVTNLTQTFSSGMFAELANAALEVNEESAVPF
ncbi:MAG: hypothetical protein WAS05_00240 [Candidatus Nanopelagicales bacterium]